ncbi:MAG: hypothetical protein A2017_01430 [Lentisphaerae bacterium GWF2_44_16]|nr:MAG: hypothetical protein A2017_01430 [Lentisphaerae bacterium GWF2_44_16]
MAKKIQKRAFKGFAGYVIVPLVVINFYAYWELNAAAGSWVFSAFPNSLPETLTQLAVILAINNLVIIFLLVYITLSK